MRHFTMLELWSLVFVMSHGSSPKNIIKFFKLFFHLASKIPQIPFWFHLLLFYLGFEFQLWTFQSLPFESSSTSFVCTLGNLATKVNYQTKSHGAIQDAFSSITRNKVSYFVWTYSHPFITFPLIFLLEVDTMILVDGIHTLVDVVIVDLTQVDLLVWVVSSCGVAAMVATQAMKNYTMIDTQ